MQTPFLLVFSAQSLLLQFECPAALSHSQTGAGACCWQLSPANSTAEELNGGKALAVPAGAPSWTRGPSLGRCLDRSVGSNLAESDTAAFLAAWADAECQVPELPNRCQLEATLPLMAQ